MFNIPYKNWTEMPLWLVQLHHLFDEIEKEYDTYLISKGYITK